MRFFTTYNLARVGVHWKVTMITRHDDHYEQVSLGAVSFVPLVKGK